MLTQEQTLARLLVVALHKLGGHLEVTEDLLNHVGRYNIVWEHVEPVKDQVGLRVSVKAGEILIAHVDNDVAEVVL